MIDTNDNQTQNQDNADMNPEDNATHNTESQENDIYIPSTAVKYAEQCNRASKILLILGVLVSVVGLFMMMTAKGPLGIISGATLLFSSFLMMNHVQKVNKQFRANLYPGQKIRWLVLLLSLITSASYGVILFLESYDIIPPQYWDFGQSDMPFPQYQNFDIEHQLDKPVIYLYPEQKETVNVRLELDGQLTCSYPAYLSNGWLVTAEPDGTLTDKEGKQYNYLYWEGLSSMQADFSTGYCVKGEDTEEFLEWALEEQGLSCRETDEFMVYWLPKLQKNPYNVISFQTENYEKTAGLQITPQPDMVIRVFMSWYGCQDYIEMTPQKFTKPTREGFTVVEWGGGENNFVSYPIH